MVLVAGKAHVLGTELALGISGRNACSRLGDVARVLFGLGAVDGNIEHAECGVALPLHILGDASGAHIVGLLAYIKIPLGRRLGRLLIGSVKVADDLARQRRHNAHQQGVKQVAVVGGVLDHAVLAGVVNQRREQLVHRGVGGRRFFVLPVIHMQRVHELIADDQLVVLGHQPVLDGIIDQLLDCGINHGISLSHQTLISTPPTGRIRST